MYVPLTFRSATSHKCGSSSFQRPLGIFQDGGVIFRQPRFQGLSLTTWGGTRLIRSPLHYPRWWPCQILHPGDMSYDQNPHPWDRLHSQSPVGSPNPPPPPHPGA